VDETGKVVGQHEGIHHFTVGQRKGVRVASIKRSWVKSICFDTNTVTITHDDENLRTKTMVVTQTDWLDSLPLNEPTKCQAQVRYRHSAKAAIVIPHQDGQALVEFDQPVRAITPGQAAVFYDGDRILGRGWIQDTE
jgi:tRNA-specific 2-thiouridylase